MPQTNELFSKKFLVGLLFISVLTNILLIIRLWNPGLVDKIQIALLPAPKVAADDHVRGNPNAEYTIIEYADFQCPYCSRFHDSMLTLMKEADVRWVYRHFPLQSHPLAQKAAEAAECAGDQGKFWEYSDALFGAKGPLREERLFSLAKDMRLDTLSFAVCLNTGKFRKRVEDQRADGIRKKISGTPTFWLNGKRFNGFVPLEDLRKIMNVKEKK